MTEITIRQIGTQWAWYIAKNGKAVLSCQDYYSGPDVAWRLAMTALEASIAADLEAA